MDERMTVCNMSIEAGARAGMIAPDATTFAYLEGRPFAPQGAAWDAAVADWQTLRSDPGAAFDKQVTLDASHARADDHVRHQSRHGHQHHRQRARASGRCGLRQVARLHGPAPRASAWPRSPCRSCSSAAAPTRGCRTSKPPPRSCAGARSPSGVRALVVPGSQQIKREAEQRGLAKIFTDAGAEWRESGCSMCLGMNGDLVDAGQYCVSTSNRNFEGRQGIGARTLLASPATAAAAAVRGRVTDPREFLG